MDQQMLRHMMATLAYRAARAMKGAPDSFADYRAMPGGRSPVEIVAHMGDLFDWAVNMADGRHEWHVATPTTWEGEVERFFGALEAFDRRLASEAPLAFPAEKLLQGPIADALTHVGQIAMLRRMAGCSARSENYVAARITIGSVGVDQPAPVFEFD